MKKIFLILLLIFFSHIVFGQSYPYWISDEGSSVWIKVNATTDSSNTFYVYTNWAGGYIGNGDDVFIFFDNFTGSTLNTSKWSLINGGGCSVSNGLLTCYGGGSHRGIITSNYTLVRENMKILSRGFVSGSTCNPYPGNNIIFGEGNFTDFYHCSAIEARYDGKVYYITNNQGFLFGSCDFNIHNYSTWRFSNGISYAAIDNNIKSYNKILPPNPILSYTYANNVNHDYIIAFKKNTTDPTISCGPLESGNFFVNGHSATGRRTCNITTSINLTDYQIELSYSLFNDTKLYVSKGETILPSYQISTYETINQTINFSILSETCSLNAANLSYNGSTYYPYFVNGNGTNNLTFGFNVVSPILINSSSYDLTFTLYASTSCLDNLTLNPTQTILPAFFSNFSDPGYTYSGQTIDINVTTINLTEKTYINESVYAIYNNSIYFGSITSQYNNTTIYTISIPMALNNSSNAYESQIVEIYHNVSSTINRNQTNSSIFVVKELENINYCDDFYTDSGLFDYIIFEGKEYYAFVNESIYSAGQNLNPNCNNSGMLGITTFVFDNRLYFTSDIRSFGNNGNPENFQFHFRTLVPFLMNYTLSAPSGKNVCIINYTHSVCAGLGASQFLIFEMFNGVPRVRNAQTNSFVIIPQNLSYRSGYVDLPDPENASNRWFFNKDINQRLSNPAYKLVNFYQTLGSGTLFDYSTNNPNRITFATHTIVNKQNAYANKIVVFVKNQTGGTIVYEDSVTRYNAYVINPSAQLIKPIWTYNLQRDLMTYKAYSPTNYLQTFISNEGYLLIDEFYNCYFLPPFAPSNTSMIYTITAYQTSCDISSLPKTNNLVAFIPKTLRCYERNGSYFVQTELDIETTFSIIKTKNDNTTSVETYNGKTLNYSTSLANLSSVEFKIGNLTKCYYEEGAVFLTGFYSLFGEIPQEVKTTTSKFLITPMFLLFMGASIINPFASIGFIILNDIYRLMSKEISVILAMLLCLLHVVIVQRVKATIKAMLIELVLLASFIMLITSITPVITGNTIQEFQNKINDIRTTITDVQTNTDIISIITSSIPTFIINIVVLLLSIPALVVQILFETINMISPTLSSAVSWAETPLVIGAYIFIAIKMYEIGRNTFQSI